MSLDYDWLSQVKTVHIIGAGLNQDKPAHRAFIDAGHRGFRMVPVHPKAAGSSILGRPIVPHPWSTSNPELFVVFLSPDTLFNQVRKWLLEGRNIPFLWLQPGAENEDIIDFLDNSNIKYSVGKCWVITINEQDIFASNPSQILPWCLQTKSVDGSECSVWNYFSSGTDYICDNPLEWVGDLLDLELSEESIPKYIRSLVKEGETLEDAAKRLS